MHGKQEQLVRSARDGRGYVVRRACRMQELRKLLRRWANAHGLIFQAVPVQEGERPQRVTPNNGKYWLGCVALNIYKNIKRNKKWKISEKYLDVFGLLAN